MGNYEFIRGLTLIVVLGARNLYAVPLDTITNELPSGVDATSSNAVQIAEFSSNTNSNQSALEAFASEQKELTSASIPHNAATSGNANRDSSAPATSLYASLLTPEAIQQYINQFGAAYPGYPGYPAYPAPIGYATATQPPAPGAAPIYPGPYVVQTGYEGYLVPTGVQESSNPQNSNTMLSPFTYLANFFSVLMMSAVFRVAAIILGAIAMVFFGGALSRFVCSFTPLCDVTITAVEYLRSEGNTKSVGRLITEGMTPERVRRATAFVQDALHKYQELQELVGSEKKDD